MKEDEIQRLAYDLLDCCAYDLTSGEFTQEEIKTAEMIVRRILTAGREDIANKIEKEENNELSIN